MDAHLHSYAVRTENARRMATAARNHRHHADHLPAGLGPSIRQRFTAHLRLRPLPTFAPMRGATNVVVA